MTLETSTEERGACGTANFRELLGLPPIPDPDNDNLPAPMPAPPQNQPTPPLQTDDEVQRRIKAIAQPAKPLSSSPLVARPSPPLPARTPAAKQPAAGPAMFAALDADAAKLQSEPPLEILNAREWMQMTLPPIKQILPGLLDASTKLLVNGSAKTRKTFFTLQAAVCLASGRAFLRWAVPVPMKILFLQGEVLAQHFQKRLIDACASLDIAPDALGDRLGILNARGRRIMMDTPPDWLVDAASGVDVLVVDPVYKFFDGEENSGKDVARFLAGLDMLAEQSKAAVVYVHHAAKGMPGDRQTIDRGSGSGVFARDFDAGLFLSVHAKAEDTLCVEPIVRAYKPIEPFSIKFQDGAFALSDVAPVVATSRNQKSGPALAVLQAAIREILCNSEMNKTTLEKELTKRGASRDGARKAISGMIDAGELDALKGKNCNETILHLK